MSAFRNLGRCVAVWPGRALRSAVDTQRRTNDPAVPPARSPNLYQTVFEPHERGSILVAAVFDGFFNTYQARIQDLVRIATGGTGRLPEGDMHPDLVQRIANEASATAQSVLNMCIRAFEYLPPVDITFGDYLRALVTADYELNPGDVYGLRANMIEAFRSRGIYPENVRSLAEESLLWENAPSVPDSVDPQKQRPKLPPLPVTCSALASVSSRSALKAGEPCISPISTLVRAIRSRQSASPSERSEVIALLTLRLSAACSACSSAWVPAASGSTRASHSRSASAPSARWS